MSDQNAALFDKLDGFYVTKSEHDWLERRFFNMTEKEKILFQGAMELEKPQEIGHVMRIASQLDCYGLFYCHQQNGQSLGETRTALLREQAEEGLEIRL